MNNYRRARQTTGFVAVVHTSDSVRFATTAGTREALVDRVAEYVADAVKDRLLPLHAGEVRQLLRDGQLECAIERYFALVGQRWDKEWLVTAAIDAGAQPETFAQVDQVVVVAGQTAAVA